MSSSSSEHQEIQKQQHPQPTIKNKKQRKAEKGRQKFEQRLFEQEQKKQQQPKQQLFEAKINDITCYLCQDLIVETVQAICGHAFCQFCLSEYLLVCRQCPVCDTRIRDKKVSTNKRMDQFIQEFHRQLGSEALADYNERKEKLKLYRADRKLQVTRTGSLVDVRDDDYFWRKGRIVRTFNRINTQQERIKFVIVQYLDSGKKQQFPAICNRLARPNFYTGRTGLPIFEDYKISRSPKKMKVYYIEADSDEQEQKILALNSKESPFKKKQQNQSEQKSAIIIVEQNQQKKRLKISQKESITRMQAQKRFQAQIQKQILKLTQKQQSLQTQNVVQQKNQEDLLPQNIAKKKKVNIEKLKVKESQKNQQSLLSSPNKQKQLKDEKIQLGPSQKKQQ